MFDYYKDDDMPWGDVKDDIKHIVIEDGVTSIGDRAFCWCEKVEKLILGNTVENIGNFAFGQNSSLVRVEFPDSLVSIEGGAFMGSGLESIEFGKGLKRMEGQAFGYCGNLTSVTVPASLEEIGDGAFGDCANLMEVLVETGSQSFSSVDGALYNKNVTEVYCVPAGKTGTYTLPTTVDGIFSSAFWGAEQLTNYVVADGHTSVYSDGIALYDDKGTLMTVPKGHTGTYDIDSSCTKILDDAFNACQKITRVTIPAGVERIMGSAFNRCQKLNAIIFEGDAPVFDSDPIFQEVKAIAYYPAGNTTWTRYVMQNYGGDLTWVVRCDPHNYVNGICTICADRKETVAAPKLKITINDATGKPSLSWGKVDGAVKYKVYRAISTSGNYNMLTSVDGTGLTDNSAVAGKSYYYYVIAQNANDVESAKSNIVGCTCDLAQPVIKLSSVSSSGKIKISWNQVEGATKYEVYRATSKSGTYNKITTTKGTSVINTSAVAGKAYYYKVRAICNTDAAASAYSAVKSLTCDLAQPVIKLSNVSSSGKIKISWNSVEGATKYEVYRATSKSGTYNRITTTKNTSVTNTSAAAGKTYYYKVRAICNTDAAASAYSVVEYLTCDLAQPVIKLSNVSSSGKIKVSWEKITGAGKYEVWRATSKTGTYKRMTTTTNTSYTDTSASAGKTYYYKVKAIHSKTDANSAYSAIVSKMCDLKRPTLTVKLNSKGKPALDWNEITGAAKYRVHIYNSSGDKVKTVLVTSSKYTHSSASKGKTYSYRVEAVCKNTSGNSAKSTAVKIKSK